MGNGNFSLIILMVLFVGFMYFFMIRPQKKQQQKRQEMLNGLKKGDPIVTIGGLHGVIDSIDQQAGTVVIDSDGIYLTFNLNAVRGVASRPAAAAPVAKSEEAANTDEQRAAKAADDTTSEADSQETASDDTTSEADNKQN